MASLQAAPNNFKTTIGEECFKSYTNAIKNDKAKPNPRRYRDWALLTTECSAKRDGGCLGLCCRFARPHLRCSAERSRI
jgi:hypothetical protein